MPKKKFIKPEPLLKLINSHLFTTTSFDSVVRIQQTHEGKYYIHVFNINHPQSIPVEEGDLQAYIDHKTTLNVSTGLGVDFALLPLAPIVPRKLKTDKNGNINTAKLIPIAAKYDVILTDPRGRVYTVKPGRGADSLEVYNALDNKRVAVVFDESPFESDKKFTLFHNDGPLNGLDLRLWKIVKP